MGLWPASRADPLGDYLAALERTVELEPVGRAPRARRRRSTDPAGRARDLQEHIGSRLEEAAAALGAEPRSGYELSLPLFGDDLKPAARRFAVAETLSHLERLVRDGRRARGTRTAGSVTYTAA